jgi:hypothetical protein
MGLRSASLACAITCVGCSTLFEYQGGPAVALHAGRDASPGVAVAGHMGIGPAPSSGKAFGADTTARMKFTTSTQNLAVGEGIFVVRDWGDIAAIYRLGAHVTFERFDDRLLVGAGPHGSVALAVLHKESEVEVGALVAKSKTFITFGPIIDVDARFTRQDRAIFFGLAVGVAFQDALREPRKVHQVPEKSIFDETPP